MHGDFLRLLFLQAHAKNRMSATPPALTPAVKPENPKKSLKRKSDRRPETGKVIGERCLGMRGGVRTIDPFTGNTFAEIVGELNNMANIYRYDNLTNTAGIYQDPIGVLVWQRCLGMRGGVRAHIYCQPPAVGRIRSQGNCCLPPAGGRIRSQGNKMRRLFFFYIYDVITSPEKEKRSTYHYCWIPNARSLSRSLSSPPPSFTRSPFPPRSLPVRDGQTSPHKPRLVVYIP
jgi:hypothetical protein